MVEAFENRYGNHSSFKLGAMDRAGYAMFTVIFNGYIFVEDFWNATSMH